MPGVSSRFGQRPGSDGVGSRACACVYNFRLASFFLEVYIDLLAQTQALCITSHFFLRQ